MHVRETWDVYIAAPAIIPAFFSSGAWQMENTSKIVQNMQLKNAGSHQLLNFFVEQDVGMQMEENGVSFYIQFEAFGQKWT